MEKIKDFVEYIKSYKKNIRKLNNISRDIGNLTYDNKELKNRLVLVSEQNNNYLKRIGEQNKQIRRLKKEIKFLTERDNKLQQIEMMFENKRVTLKDLKELVKENGNNI